MEFTGKRALVTGGSRGIGRAVVERLAAEGACVAIAYRADREAADATLASLSGGPHIAIRADLADRASAGYLVKEAVAGLGGLDILVNNAGIAINHCLDEIGFDEWEAAWEKTLAVNLLGPVHTIFFAAKQMIDQGGGRIVSVSSRGAFRGEPDMPAYAASKAGLNAMSQSLAKRLGPHGIGVGVVAPGFVDTDMAAPFLEGSGGDAIRNQSALGRIARPEEVAAAVIFLCRKETEFLTGAIIDVNGASYLRS